MLFKVVKVNDSGTLKVSPTWEWKRYIGSTVRSLDPEMEKFAEGKSSRLRELLLNKEIELSNAVEKSNDNKLHCDIFVDGKKLSQYVKELI